MRQQRWLHLPAPAKTRCRTNDRGTHAPPVVFSISNFEECSFFLFESLRIFPTAEERSSVADSSRTKDTIRISGRSPGFSFPVEAEGLPILRIDTQDLYTG